MVAGAVQSPGNSVAHCTLNAMGKSRRGAISSVPSTGKIYPQSGWSDASRRKMKKESMKCSVVALALLVLAGSLFARPVLAGELYVIAHRASQLSGVDVRDVYIGDKQMAGALKLVPVDNAALQREFLDKVVRMNPTKYATLWTKKGFRDGLNAPPLKSGDAEVIAFVRATPGAIAYVSALPSGVDLIQKY